MIEVEKRFALEGGNEEKLIADAVFVSEKAFIDVYYDDGNCTLTKQDMWLRCRAGRFELKVRSRTMVGDEFVNQSEELETESEIIARLELDPNCSFEESLLKKEYIPFCSIKTTRKEYKKDGYVIDIDSTDFGYRVVEIELMVENTAQAQEAAEKIVSYGKDLGLKVDETVRGKVTEYLLRNSPAHFQTLVEANVFLPAYYNPL